MKKHGRDYSPGRLDVVFNTYKQNSLKRVTKVKRGKGARGKPQRDSSVPSKWQKSLQLVENNLNFSNTSQQKFIPRIK